MCDGCDNRRKPNTSKGFRVTPVCHTCFPMFFRCDRQGIENMAFGVTV